MAAPGLRLKRILEALFDRAEEGVPTGTGRGAWIASVLLGAVAPYVVYESLVPPLSEVAGLAWGAVPPALWQLVSLVRARRVDVLSAFSLMTTALGLGLAWTSGSERALLLREAWMTGIIGVVSMFSAFTHRPLLYFALRTAEEASGEADFDQSWRTSPALRRGAKRLTVVWGAAGLVDMLSRLWLVDRVSTATFLAISPVLFWAGMAAVAGVTYVYGVRMRDEVDAEVTAYQSPDV